MCFAKEHSCSVCFLLRKTKIQSKQKNLPLSIKREFKFIPDLTFSVENANFIMRPRLGIEPRIAVVSGHKECLHHTLPPHPLPLIAAQTLPPTPSPSPHRSGCNSTNAQFNQTPTEYMGGGMDGGRYCLIIIT